MLPGTLATQGRLQTGPAAQSRSCGAAGRRIAEDRNLLGIDPAGVVNIARRLLSEVDGPMLTTGLQGFHGKPIALPRRPADRPDPVRLQTRFDLFVAAA